MLTERLTAKNRSPSAVRFNIGFVNGRALRFHKRSDDGSGKCDVYETGIAGDVVWGVVFEVPDAEMNQLRTAEGSGHGYHESPVRVEYPDHSTDDVTAFVADADAINVSLQPYVWYLDLVLAGAEEHELPEKYVRVLRAVHAVPDPKPHRRTKIEAEHALARHRSGQSRSLA